MDQWSAVPNKSSTDVPAKWKGQSGRLPGPWLLSVILLLLACQLGETTPPTPPVLEARPTPAAAVGPLLGTALTSIPAAPLPGFAPWQLPEVRDLPGRASDNRFPVLARLTNPADLWPLNEAQRERLAAVGFVSQPPGERFFHNLYLEAAADGRPVFVTTDVILHLTHLILADTWAEVENGQLRDDLTVLATSMSDASQGQWALAPPSLQPAAGRTTAYFAVAAKLLDESYPVPEAVTASVSEELILIDGANGVFQSPIFGYQQDYGRFQPPAGYQGSAERIAYFQAAEWLSSMAFELGGPAPASRQHGLSLLILLQTLEASQNWTRWQRIATTHAYFLGPPAGWTLADYAAVARELNEGRLPDTNDLSDPLLVDRFLLTAQAARAPRASVLQIAPVAQWPDRDILSGLTFNRVGLYEGDPLDPPRSAANTEVGLIRAFPLALDVAAAYGSGDARRLLANGADTQYAGYDAQLAALTRSDDSQANTVSLNSAWLWSLKPLLSAPNADTPLFMRGEGWSEIQLISWVGAWSELRRDQAATRYKLADPAIFAPEPTSYPDAAAYLAPEPALYAGLVATTAQVRAGLSSRGLLSSESNDRLAALEAILQRLQVLAEQELAGVALRPDEERYLRLALAELFQLSLTEEGSGSEVAFIATLYADPNSGRQWQIGVGSVQPIFVLVPYDEGYAVAVGGIYSTYGVSRPAGDPLTMAEWLVGDRPAPLPWVEALTVP